MPKPKSNRGFVRFLIAGIAMTAASTGFAQDHTALFKIVTVKDEVDLIGDGTHERVVVNVAKFDQRVQKKLRGGSR